MQTFFFEMYIAIGIIVSVVMLFGSYLKEIEEMERKFEKVDKPMLGAMVALTVFFWPFFLFFININDVFNVGSSQRKDCRAFRG